MLLFAAEELLKYATSLLYYIQKYLTYQCIDTLQMIDHSVNYDFKAS